MSCPLLTASPRVITLFSGFVSPLSAEFWIALYQRGQIGATGEEYLPLLILARLVVSILILLATNLLVKQIDRLIKRTLPALMNRTGNSQRRLITLNSLISSTIAYLIYFSAFILILFTIGLTWKALAPLLGAASVLGLAIGFGAQRLVRDIITGLFILGEGQFDVGDCVTIGGVSGTVEEMELRVTRIRDDQGRLYVIANGDITQVFNASRGNIRLPIELAIQRTTVLGQALETIQQIARATLAECDVEPTVDRLAVTVVGMDAAKVTVRLTLWVPNKRKDRIEDQVRRRLLDALNTPELMLA